MPHKWSYNQQGDLIIAKNPHAKKKVAELPSELLQALESSFFGIRESAVNELGNYLRSRDPDMVELAVASLQRMKEDDSRRISSLAERLLRGFEQEQTPIKVDPAKSPDVIEPEMAGMTSDNTMASPKVTTEIESPPEVTTSQATIEKGKVLPHTPAVPQTSGLDLFFWSKWIAIAVLGYVILPAWNTSFYDNNIVKSVPILFAILIGSLSVMQWFGFRNQLGSRWIPANAAGGIFMGGVNYFIYEYTDWWGKDELFRVLLLANLVLGIILVRRMGGKQEDLLPKSNTEFIEADPRRNIFVMLLSIFLVLHAFVALMGTANDSGLLYLSDWLKNASWTLYGITGIFAGVSFLLTKEIPRNFGYVTLAIFLFLNGIVVELFDYAPGSSPYFFHIPGTIALLASVFFVSERETWKHFRYIMLSGYLIFVSLLYFGADVVYGTYIFSIITAIFALLAGIFFFLRK